MSIGYRLLSAVARVVVRCATRLRARSVERVPPCGPVLLVSNHLGKIDPYMIGAYLPRQLRILAKAEIFEWPVLGALARWGGAVPVRRGDADRAALRRLELALARGECVLVFPEGGYDTAPERAEMAPVKSGAAWLALRTRALVVPVAVWGTERFGRWRRGWRPWRRAAVHVVFGEPYRPEAPEGLPLHLVYRAIADDMARRIAALLPEDYRGCYAEECREPVAR